MRKWMNYIAGNMPMFMDEGEGGGGGAPSVASVEGGMVSSSGTLDGSVNSGLTNTATGDITNITGGLVDGDGQITEPTQTGQGEGQIDLPPSEISLDSFDDYFDWEDGEKDATLAKIQQANITPEQFDVFKEMTGGILENVSAMQKQNQELSDFIKRDYEAEGQKLTEAKWSKADVQDVLNFAGGLLGEGGVEKLSKAINSADVLFAFKAMKDKIIGSDNALEGAGQSTEPTYTQDAFLADIQKYYKMVAQGKSGASEFLKKIKERGMRYGDEALKRDLKQNM